MTRPPIPVVQLRYGALENTDLGEPVLREVADAPDVSTAQAVLRWHLAHGFVVIPQPVTPERIRANVAVAGFSLTAEEVGRIAALAAP
jgi:2,5-diketo-D-gluconate reductase A